MGVFLNTKETARWWRGLPHARGGVSSYGAYVGFVPLSSPRPWGCFYTHALKRAHRPVFPTPVGVFLHLGIRWMLRCCLPHARGGVSQSSAAAHHRAWSSPRPWGCFQIKALKDQGREVFPTPVGVFLICMGLAFHEDGLPHARGGVSVYWVDDGPTLRSSPRPWGCFSAGGMCTRAIRVFPTPVGVFLCRTHQR